MILREYVAVDVTMFMCKRVVSKRLYLSFRKFVSTVYWTVCSPVATQIGASKYAFAKTIVAEFAATVGGLRKDQLHNVKIIFADTVMRENDN